MDFKLTQETAFMKKVVYEGNVEQGVDVDVTLPDYCADILRILKCYVVPQITGHQVSGDRLLIDGTVVVRFLYVDDNAKTVRSYEHVSPFSKSLELNGLPDNPSVRINTKVEYVNCRAVNPRRLDLHGAFTMSIKVMSRQKEDFITEASGADIQLKRRDMVISNVIGDIQRQFVVSEVLDLGDTKPPVLQIIRTNGIAVVNEHKVIKNKLLIKGELMIKTLYSTDKDNGKLEMMEHTIPVSQIIDMEGINDDCCCDIRLDVLTLEVIPKTDSSGDMRLLDCNARLCAAVGASRNITIPVITDAYSLKYDLSAEYKTISNERISDSFTETFLCKKKLDLSATGVSEVSDIWCNNIVNRSDYNEGKLAISGNITICMLLTDGSGKLTYAERQIDFEYEQVLKESIENIKCDANVRAIAADYSISDTSSVDVRIELKIDGTVISVESEKIISAIEINEKTERKADYPPLVIYFADSGESIWQIARKYNTTVGAIMEENGIKTETVEEKRMILIPAVDR